MCIPRRNDTFLIFHPAGKAGEGQIRRCQGIAIKYDGFTLGALALSPSDFGNAGVNKGLSYGAPPRDVDISRFDISGFDRCCRPDMISISTITSSSIDKERKSSDG
jgi:hypothetical protein